MEQPYHTTNSNSVTGNTTGTVTTASTQAVFTDSNELLPLVYHNHKAKKEKTPPDPGYNIDPNWTWLPPIRIREKAPTQAGKRGERHHAIRRPRNRDKPP